MSFLIVNKETNLVEFVSETPIDLTNRMVDLGGTECPNEIFTILFSEVEFDTTGMETSTIAKNNFFVNGTLSPVKPTLSAADVQAEVTKKTQERLDNFARQRGYDGILSACTYVGSAIPKFNDEGIAARNARDMTWAALYGIMQDIMDGKRQMISSYEEIEGELPACVWPA